MLLSAAFCDLVLLVATVCCCLLLFSAVCSISCHLLPNMTPRSSKKALKPARMVPKSPQGVAKCPPEGSKSPPWSVKIHPRGVPGCLRDPCGQQVAIMSPSLSIWSPKIDALRDPKIDKKRTQERKSASGDGAGSDFCRFFSPVPFGVALQIDFWSVRPFKIVLPPQREHDFDKITVFKKTPKK